jgi:hypothetical protein
MPPITKAAFIKCAICQNDISIRVYADPSLPNFHQPIVQFKKTRFCSLKCQKTWQQETPWETRVGQKFADHFRDKMSKLSTENNPSTFPGVAEKISKSLKKYKADNPPIGEKNSFFGRKHSDKTKLHLSQSKKGKWSYNQEQYEKSKERSPKKERHPNWRGGSSYEPYGPGFDRKFKKQIKESYNWSCQLCNVATDILDIHHIDYNKNNNSRDNLIPLCKVCHGKTNFDRESWIPLLKQKIKE